MMTPQDASDAVQRFDAAMLDKIVALGGAELLGQLVALFLDQLAPRVAAVEAAVRGESIEEGVRAAHTLKSTSRQFGFAALGRVCGGIEAAGRDGDLAAVDRLLPALREAVADARATLLEEIERRKAVLHA